MDGSATNLKPRINANIFITLKDTKPDEITPLADMLQGVFHNDQFDNAEASVKILIKKGKRRSNRRVPIPITELESYAIDNEITKTLERMKVVRSKVNNIRSIIDTTVNTAAQAGGSLDFNVDVSHRSSLKRAIKNLFHTKLDTITYEMYKAMLVAKTELEKSQGKDYYNGKFEK